MSAHTIFNTDTQEDSGIHTSDIENLFGVDISPFAEPSILDLHDWQQFCGFKTPARPTVPTREQFIAMTAQEQKVSKILRSEYCSSYGPIMTKSFTELFEHLMRLAHTGRKSGYGVRLGAVCTGPGTVGKSTLLTNLGKAYDSRLRIAMRARFGNDGNFMPDNTWRFAPVVYVTLKGDSSLKGIYHKMARFLLVPNYESMNTMQLYDRVVRHAKHMGVTMVIIDDIHYLHRRFKGASTINNDLKSLMSEIPATFILAGIHCDAAGLFDEYQTQVGSIGSIALDGSSSQTNHRFSRHEIVPFTEKNKNLEEANVKQLRFCRRPEQPHNGGRHDQTQTLHSRIQTRSHQTRANRRHQQNRDQPRHQRQHAQPLETRT